MSFRTLDTSEGVGGGAVNLCKAAKQARSIHVTVYNLDIANPHVAYFGRSRRELVRTVNGLQGGVALPVPQAAVPAAGNGIQFAPGQGVVTIGGIVVAISTFVLQAWAGELWAVADATNKVQVEVLDSAVIES